MLGGSFFKEQLVPSISKNAKSRNGLTLFSILMHLLIEFCSQNWMNSERLWFIVHEGKISIIHES
jgi:hypothetical protein